MIVSDWILQHNKLFNSTKLNEYKNWIHCWTAFESKRQTSLGYSNEMQPRCINATCTCIFTTEFANICVIYACAGTKWVWATQLWSPQSAPAFMDSPLHHHHHHHHTWPTLSPPPTVDCVTASQTVAKEIMEKIPSELAELLRGFALVVWVKNR